MCLSIDWRDRVHLYGIVSTWLNLLIIGLLANEIATDAAMAISPDNGWWRNTFRLLLIFILFFALILINAARFSTELNPWSKFLSLVQHFSNAANLDTGPLPVSNRGPPPKSAPRGPLQPLLRSSAQPQHGTRPLAPQPQTNITIVSGAADVPYRAMTVEPAAPSYEALRSAHASPTGQQQQHNIDMPSVQFAFTAE